MSLDSSLSYAPLCRHANADEEIRPEGIVKDINVHVCYATSFAGCEGKLP